MPREEFLQQLANSVDALANQVPASPAEPEPEDQDAPQPEEDAAEEPENSAKGDTEPESLPPLDGEFDYVDADGKKHHVTYAQGQQTGPFHISGPDDQLELLGTLVEGLPDGPLETYQQGVLRSRVDMAKGIPHGKMTLFNEKGQITSEIAYQNGQRHGEMKTFYANGNVQNLVTYEQDKKNGVMETYSETGELMAQVFYKDDTLDGQETFYDNQGQVVQQSVYELGEKVSSTDAASSGG